MSNQKYILAIDIGNTSTVIGFFRDGVLADFFRLASTHTRTADEAGVLITHLRKHQVRPNGEIGGAVICSVVPGLTQIFQDMAVRYCNAEPIVVSADSKLSIRLQVDNPAELGPDRIANAEGFIHKYEGAGIVVDFGTATTFDVISAQKDYLGGVIAPGVETSSARLSERAARLFKIHVERPSQVIGKNTADALKSGLLYGTVGQVEGIINRITECLNAQPRIIATGGLASTIARETSIINEVDETLTLSGLLRIYEQNT
jgi:type III pantothenate kinase